MSPSQSFNAKESPDMSANDNTENPYEANRSLSLPMAGELPRPAIQTPQVQLLHNCVSCQQRKVKCDRIVPCSSCKRSRVECIASIPTPAKRRKRKVREDELRAKVTKYEGILKEYGKKCNSGSEDGVSVEGDKNEFSTSPKAVNRPSLTPAIVETVMPSTKRIELGQMISQNGMSKFLDNNLWTGLSNEFLSPRELLQGTIHDDNSDFSCSDSTDHNAGSLLFAVTSPVASLTVLHPQPVQIFRLWQAFLDNVNPLSKIIHAPTMQHLILEASARLDKISRSMEALMFAIYATSVNSMDNKECEQILGESKKILLTRYINATQGALVRAGFLRSTDLVVLQALTLFLLAARQYYDPHTIWILAGVAVRIGQRMGIHRDGALIGLPVFEAEMRRRLCWQIVVLDSRSAQLSGTGVSVSADLWDTRLPANINDSDLSPEMRELPFEHKGITEMVFCLIRYEFGNFLRGGSTWGGFDGNWQKLSGNDTPLTEKDKIVDHLENYLENKFARYCDPLIPLHAISASLIRTAVCKLRFVAHHPQQYPDKGISMSQEERNVVFATSLKMIEYDSLGQSMQSLKRFLWHVNVHFQFDAIVFTLSELRHRTSGPLVDKAWQQIQEVYENHPELITKASNELYAAVGNLTLKAWKSREGAVARQLQRSPNVPAFISSLQAKSTLHQRLSDEDLGFNKPLHANHSLPVYEPSTAVNEYGGGFQVIAPNSIGLNGGELDRGSQLDMSPVDWDFWNGLLQDNDLQNFDDNGQKLFG